MNVKQLVKDFLREEDGLTTVEYAVAGGVIAAGVITAFSDLGTTVEGLINEIVTELGERSKP